MIRRHEPEARAKAVTTQESRTDRALSVLLRPFARIEPSEALNAVVMTLTVFLLLTAYYLLKTAREPLILLHGGAEVKSYAAAGQAVLLLGFVQLYGWVARRVGKMRLLLGVYLFFALNLLLFAAAAGAGLPVAVPFYLWVGVYNYTSIAQFWGYASDVYTPDQGKRIFSVIGVGSSLGAVAGAHLAKLVVPLGPQALMLGAAILLGVCCGLLVWVNTRVEAPAPAQAKKEDAQPISKESAFALLLHDKYLILIAVLTLLINWCNSTGEYILDRTLLTAVKDHTQHADPTVFVGQFKAEYFELVNIVGVLLQLFAVSRILDKLGVRAALFFLPAVAFAGYAVILVAPVLSLIRWAKVAENSIDYSVQNTARQALYLVATRVEKYVGKIAVDSFFVRFGDVLSAIAVYVGSKLALPTQVFAALNMVLVLVWIFVVVLVGREHRRRSEELEKEGTPDNPQLRPATT